MAMEAVTRKDELSIKDRPLIGELGTSVVHAASDGSGFKAGLREYFEYRDTGMMDATGGNFAGHVIRVVPSKIAGFKPQWHNHETSFQMFYVLKGWVDFEYQDIGVVRMNVGSAVYQPDRIRHRQVACSDDFEVLEIVSPGNFATNLIEDD
jgi:mannose-6-phosphate isomerase-like protein (cupin superfamily)